MGHYNENYEEQEYKQKKEQDSLRKMKIEHLRESIQPKLEKLDKELKENFRKSRPTLAEEDCYYAIKNYIDKRFDILIELMIK